MLDQEDQGEPKYFHQRRQVSKYWDDIVFQHHIIYLAGVYRSAESREDNMEDDVSLLNNMKYDV